MKYKVMRFNANNAKPEQVEKALNAATADRYKLYATQVISGNYLWLILERDEAHPEVASENPDEEMAKEYLEELSTQSKSENPEMPRLEELRELLMLGRGAQTRVSP